MTAAETLIKGWVIPPVQLVDGKLPDWMGAGGTLTGVSMTLVRHPEVEGVGPDGDATQGRRDTGVIHEALVGHHGELRVAPGPEVGRPHPDDGVVRDVGECLCDQASARHLSQPVIVASL